MQQDNGVAEQLAAEIGIDEAEIVRRKSFLELSEKDEQLLQEVHEILGPNRSVFIDRFYKSRQS